MSGGPAAVCVNVFGPSCEEIRVPRCEFVEEENGAGLRQELQHIASFCFVFFYSRRAIHLLPLAASDTKQFGSLFSGL